VEVKELKRELLRAAFDSFLMKYWGRKLERGEQFRQFLEDNGIDFGLRDVSAC